MLDSIQFLRGVRLSLLLAGLVWLVAVPAWAQLDSLGGLTGQLSRYIQRNPREQLFLHLDRPLYLSGETMWFKVYAVGGADTKPLAMSSVAYVEVLDAVQKPVLQGKIALQQATGRGTFALPAGLASGRYTVRAYTRWMQNFAPEEYFSTTVTILNTFTASGAAPAPDSAVLEAQFFPEGGHLVRGIRSKVGFKVMDKRGRAVAATGTVLDAQGKAVATFSTLRNGMGSFLLTPAATGPATYTAIIQPAATAAGARPLVTSRPLPTVQNYGYVLSITPATTNQITLTVQSTEGQPNRLLLLVHARQQPVLTRRLELRDGRAQMTIDAAQLPGGVSHFTLFNETYRPLCERLYFRVPPMGLKVVFQTNRLQYVPREKVQLQITATVPTRPASMSVSVYRLDSLNSTSAPSIDQYLHLTAELRGVVQNPGYYFSSATDPTVAEATDALLLTQGWSRFKWDEVLSLTPPRPAFAPELYGPQVLARVTAAGTDAPRAGLLTYFSVPGRLFQFDNDRSDEQGLVRFEPGNFYGPHTVMLQTDPRQDSTCRLTLLDSFSDRFARIEAAPFSLHPRFRNDYARRHLQSQVQTMFAGNKYDRYVASAATDSLPFYGRASELYMLDNYTRFKVMEEVMREYVQGVQVRIRDGKFNLQTLDLPNRSVFQDNPMVLLDGVPIFNMNKVMALNPIKIRQLDAITSRYIHGTAVYSGLVSLRTYKGNLEGFQLDPRVLIQEYEGLQEQREFYAPRYDTPEQQRSRRPDMRELLYWNPAVTVAGPGGAPQPLEFFTGDQPGRYLIEVQGLDATGRAGSSRSTFEVQPAL
ncbi:hypothetical protein J7E24_01310 [Hymenobacter sp. ISL-91]|uniref:hypothetical protein n=1 Tax=Hymenobacter sp. ISL-91 TaxID=2819151 RepID=UPI001BE64838|nr:hypothetical protein [Hymenobacter sp. ISL-91]MBT2556414.1 hypothetical protein [Hymenobacter sp. ISL-91]